MVVICRRRCWAWLMAVHLVVVQTWSTLTGAEDVAAARPRVLTYSVVEEQPPGTAVGDLLVDLGLSPSDEQQIHFDLLPGTNREFFEVESGSGVLYVGRQIDRDSICSGLAATAQSGTSADGEICRLDIDVALMRPVTLFHAFQVRVLVLDVNDNDPTFDVERFTLAIPESVSPGRFYILPQAYDADSRPNSVAGYEFSVMTSHGADDYVIAGTGDVTEEGADEEEEGPFRLETLRRDDASYELRLIVTQRLDRETVSRYSCRLVAFDGGHPSRSASLDVSIVVADSNDNTPQFDRQLYETTVAEDFPLGTPLLLLRAVDADSGLNGLVEYGLARHGGASRGDDSLLVNATTGHVTLRQSLDYERQRTLTTLVIARDAGPAANTAYARVIVHVTDVNDHAPDIRVHRTATDERCDAAVDENLPPETFVVQLSVADLDSGDNGRTDCRLERIDESTDATGPPSTRGVQNIDDLPLNQTVDNITEFTLRRVHSSLFTVSTAVALDREAADRRPMLVRCWDAGRPPLKATALLTVCVGDRNDNAPRFVAERYSVSVAESAAAGTVILQATAIDPDAGKNAQLVYYIRSDDDEVDRLFSLDERAGTLSLIGGLDYENRTRFEFTVVATDGGRPPLSSSVEVTVDVADVNDEQPRFTRRRYEFAAYENEPIGTVVGSVAASDADSSPFDRFRYHVAAASIGGGGGAALGVNPRDGRVFTLRPLDRELCAVHRLTLVARDDHAPHHTATADVVVRVLDRNDNAPLIASSAGGDDGAAAAASALTFPVSARSRPGQLVGVVAATDADAGDNARLHWSIAGGGQHAVLFSIESDSGRLFLGRDTQLSLVNVDLFQLSVLVRDHGAPPKSAVVQVDVVVVNRTLASGAAAAEDAWTDVLSLSSSIIIVVAVTLVAGLLLLVLLLLLTCCLCRSKVRRARRSTDVVCPSPRPALTSARPLSGVSGSRKQLTDGEDWTLKNSLSGGCGTFKSQLAMSQSGAAESRLSQQATLPLFGRTHDRLSTYVTFQDSECGLYTSCDWCENDSQTNVWRRRLTPDEAEVTRLLELLRHDGCDGDDSVICDCSSLAATHNLDATAAPATDEGQPDSGGGCAPQLASSPPAVSQCDRVDRSGSQSPPPRGAATRRADCCSPGKRPDAKVTSFTPQRTTRLSCTPLADNALSSSVVSAALTADERQFTVV